MDLKREFKGRNVFQLKSVAEEYDAYYLTDIGRAVDAVEKPIVAKRLKQFRKLSGGDCNRMLELGCGTGHWTQFFSEQGFRVTAVDESVAMLEHAQRRGLAGVEWLEASADSLPFDDKSFSLITSITMFEFVEDPKLVLEEVDRLLRPGGTLLVGWLNSESQLRRVKDSSPTYRHGQFYSSEEIEEFLRRFGPVEFDYAVYYDEDFNLKDEESDREECEPAFIVTSLQKGR